MDNKHVPVLLEECVENLRPALERKQSVLVDGTLGGAGHTVAFLERFPDLTVLACDIDATAIAAARQRLDPYLAKHRVVFFHGSFSEIVTDSQAPIQQPWDAILVDLGYSSNQLEDPGYGMSFQVDAPLDMRLRRPSHDLTAWDILEQSTAKELADILYAYGEINDSRRVAKVIKQALEERALKNSTQALARLIQSHSQQSQKKDIHPATTVFQALRIAVNDELRVLDAFLKHAMLCLRKGGRLGVITFHSLEDRIVKHWGNSGTDFFPVNKKPIVASEREINENPRARSAKLRIYEKK